MRYNAILKAPVTDPRQTLKKCGRPKLLIIGHARHGKDTLAEKICSKMGLKFASSSVFVGKECIWPGWGSKRYASFEAMFADRVNCRKEWADLISAYNTPDKARTAKTMLGRGFDMYVGMRRMDEFLACRGAGLFNHVIWVDAAKRLPLEGRESNEMTANCANIHCDNNGPIEAMDSFVGLLQLSLSCEGYSVEPEESVLGDG